MQSSTVYEGFIIIQAVIKVRITNGIDPWTQRKLSGERLQMAGVSEGLLCRSPFGDPRICLNFFLSHPPNQEY